MRTTVRAVALVATLCLARNVGAVFHAAHISEVMSGVGADATVQYVEIVMDADFQNAVMNSVLSTFSCDGLTRQELLVIPGTVPNAGHDVHWIIASAATIGGVTADFSWNPAVTGNIPTSCGMVCWGAPGVQTPPPGNWNHDVPNNYVDCVAYGPYTGTTKTADPDVDGVDSSSGTPTTLTPGDGTLSLTRQSEQNDNATDFALACPTPTNNAGQAGSFTSCTSTTTTVATSTTTTSTTLPRPPVQPVAGGGSKKTDCYGVFRVAGGSGKPVVRCQNGAATCDVEDHPDDCHFLVQLCFGDPTNTKCPAADVTRFEATSPVKDDVDGENLATMTAAVLELDGQASGEHAVAFSTPPAAGTCTEPFLLDVPLKTTKGGKMKKGMRVLKTAITAGGKVDKDKLKLICAP